MVEIYVDEVIFIIVFFILLKEYWYRNRYWFRHNDGVNHINDQEAVVFGHLATLELSSFLKTTIYSTICSTQLFTRTTIISWSLTFLVNRKDSITL